MLFLETTIVLLYTVDVLYTCFPLVTQHSKVVIFRESEKEGGREREGGKIEGKKEIPAQEAHCLVASSRYSDQRQGENPQLGHTPLSRIPSLCRPTL